MPNDEINRWADAALTALLEKLLKLLLDGEYL